MSTPEATAKVLDYEVPGLAAGPEGKYAQFWPHVHGTDAMFLALFRRKPERHARPSNRPPQRRVADLIAEAERHRTAAEQPGRVMVPAVLQNSSTPSMIWVTSVA